MTLLDGELANSTGFGYRTTNDFAEATMDAHAEVGQTFLSAPCSANDDKTYSEPSYAASVFARIPLDRSWHKLSLNAFGSSQVVLIEGDSTNTQTFL
jgi:hypothetical protein